jgi:YHS domain-containing protein
MESIATTAIPLEKRLHALLADSESRQKNRTQARMVEMQATQERLRLFDRIAHACMKEGALPRLETLIRALGNGSRPEVREKGDSVSVTFRSTPRFPIGADVSLILSHDPKIENLMGLWKVSIIPILMDYEREATTMLALDAPDLDRFSGFLDDHIARFMSDYLAIHEPDSPYLQIERVTDPACGMTFPRTEAAACAEHDGKTYYFCVEACRDLFAKDPAGSLRRLVW